MNKRDHGGLDTEERSPLTIGFKTRKVRKENQSSTCVPVNVCVYMHIYTDLLYKSNRKKAR